MNHDNNEPTVKVSARRRLVRGVFAAPAALTLYSGGAFANTSMTCVAKDVTAAQQPEPSGSEEGPANEYYVRVQLYTLMTTTPDQIPTVRISNWVRGADVILLQKTGKTSFVTNNDQWFCFSNPGGQKLSDNSTPAAGDVIAFVPAAHPDMGTAQPLTQNGAWVALRIDASGDITGIVGLVNKDSGGFGVHRSCWTSFRAA